AETYTFDGVPSMLTLATVPTFATHWSGIATVYLETNGMSTVSDPSGTVLIDVLPPGPPNTAQPPYQTPSIAAEESSLVQALLDAILPRASGLPADLLIAWSQTPKQNSDLQVWAAWDM